MAAPRLAFAVGPASGALPTQPVTAFTTGSLKLNLRSGPEFSTTIPGQSPAALQTSGLSTDVWIYKNGALFRRTRILPVDQTWGPDGQDDAVITSVGYQRLVEARHIIALGALPAGVPVFTAVDQGTILRNLVEHTQAQTGGSLGITFGTVISGQVRTRTEYKVGDNLGTLMTALGDVVNGTWWGIDAAKVMTAKLWTAFATRTDAIVLGMNARRLTRQRGKTFANAAGAVGSSLLTAPVWVVTGTVGTDPRGRWEAFDASHSSVEMQATVTEYANGLLNASSYPPSAWTVELDPAAYFEGSSNYAEGEFVPIVIPTSAVDELAGPAINVLAQITEVAIGFDDSGTVTVTLAALEVS